MPFQKNDHPNPLCTNEEVEIQRGGGQMGQTVGKCWGQDLMDCWGAASPNQLLFLLQTVKGFTLNLKVLNVHFPSCFSFSCPALLYWILRNQALAFSSWHLILQTHWHCSQTLSCCTVFALNPVNSSLLSQGIASCIPFGVE